MADGEPGPAAPLPSERLESSLRRWVAAGVITEEQAAAIRELEPADAGGVRGRATGSLLAEAFGYLGGALILIAAAMVTARYWNDLGTTARLLLGVLTAVLLLAGGALVPGSGAAPGRIRAVLWGASSLAAAAVVALGGDAARWSPEVIAMVASATLAGWSALLWALRPHLLQQVTAFAGAAGLLATATGQLPDARTLPALAVWALAMTWFVLAWGGLLRPRRGALLLAAVVAIVAAFPFTQHGPGIAFATVTVLALLAVAIGSQDLVLLGVASVGVLILVPRVVRHYLPGTIPAVLALLGCGVGLVAAAIWVARRDRGATQPRPWWRQAPPGLAVAASTGIVLVSTAVVLGAGTR